MLNQLTLMGRATRDPELRKTNDGKPVSSVTLACDESGKKDEDKNTLFLTCNFFGNTAETLCKYVKKGDLVAVVGRLRQRKYTNRDNVEVTTYELMADRLELMPKSMKANQGNRSDEGGYVVDDVPAKKASPVTEEDDLEELDSLPF